MSNNNNNNNNNPTPKYTTTTSYKILRKVHKNRPTIQTDYVKPTFANWAHRVVEPLDNPSSSSFGAIYVGPMESMLNNPTVSQEIRTHHITGIVNCTPNLPCHHHSSVEYCRVPVNDEVCADIVSYLEGATAFVHAHVSGQRSFSGEGGGGSVLVHCSMGVSRSSTVVIAYLIKYRNMSREDAYTMIKRRRPRIDPNVGFWNQLGEFEVLCRRRGSGGSEEMMPIKKNGENWSDWVKRSHAFFATLGDMLTETGGSGRSSKRDEKENDCEIFYRRLIYDGLPSSSSRDEMEKLLYAALDYVWSRGVLDFDVEWLKRLCVEWNQRRLKDDGIIERDGENENEDVEDAREIIYRMLLREEGSEFLECWVGEVYPDQIESVRRILSRDDD